ncbi:MAG: RNA polymerase factor sigma-54 [Alphaproteobacteria bacterium]
MALGFRLEQRQSQQLVMTPQLQQAIKLLQMSNLELREYVEAEMESNPLIRVEESAGGAAAKPEAEREAPPETAPDPGPSGGETPLDARLTPEGDHSLGAETFDTGAENLYDIGPGDSGTRETGPGEGGAWARVGAGGNRSFDAPGFDLEQQPDRPASLRAHLLAQLGQSRAEAAVVLLARLLVEELDEHGLLRTDLAELAARLGAAPEQVEAALALLQGCEPTGVGARDLAECLALQLAERDRLDPAMRRLVENLDLVQRGERKRLRALCGVDEEDFADMLAELRTLDPRPCAGYQAERAETLIPDVLLRRAPGGYLGGGGWEIELNPETLPRVLVDNRYAARLAKGGREARAFISDCRASAGWLKRSLDQRARTILTVATEIVRSQDRFFAEGITGLKPLTLRMVAEATGLHESTASRVTSNKYIATERGIFELKFFFTNAVGPEGMAAAAVRHRIRAMIDAEGAGGILSDDTIVERLQEDGIDIARRTVAKYRRVLGIPSSVERRRMQAMMTQG